MKPFGMLKFPIILVGFGAALLLAPACKAQEVSPDHFTDTGVQDVYDVTQAKAATPKAKQKPVASLARASQTNSPAKLQPVAKRTPVSASLASTHAVADKRKDVSPATKKQ